MHACVRARAGMHARFAIPSSRFYVFLLILYEKIIMLHKARYVKKWSREGEEVPTKKKKKKKLKCCQFLRSIKLKIREACVITMTRQERNYFYAPWELVLFFKEKPPLWKRY